MWHHSPAHRLESPGAYMVTAGTFRKQPFFNTPQRRDLLQDKLFELSDRYDWRLQAWAILNNHYHFIAMAKDKPEASPRSSGLCTHRPRLP
jgi:REP element-mobilizing transposase RayT